MQPRPMADTVRDGPSVRRFNGGDPDSAALRQSCARRLPPCSASDRRGRRSAALPALRVWQGVLSVPLGTLRPPAAVAANGVPSSELDPVAHADDAARHLALLLVNVDA